MKSDNMNPHQILEKIIEEEGSCSWSSSKICSLCPLGNVTIGDSSNLVSCLDAVNIDGLSGEEADAKYKEAAKQKLADISMQEVIEND